MSLERFRLKHLQMLVTLSEHKKVSYVAQIYNLTQPALSRTLAELEFLTQAKLFARHNRGTALTPEGEILARHARIILSQMGRAEYEIAVASMGKRGTCALGTVMTPAADFVAPTLASLDGTNIDINIVVGSSDTLLADVAARKLDFAICRHDRGFDRDWFDYQPLGHEKLKLVVSNDNLLCNKDEVSAEDLNLADWVLQPKGSVIRRVVEDFHEKFGIVPKNILSTTSILLTLQVVRKSNRVGLFGASTADLFESHGMLRALTVGADLSLPGYGLLKLRGEELSPAASTVYHAFHQQAKASLEVVTQDAM